MEKKSALIIVLLCITYVNTFAQTGQLFFPRIGSIAIGDPHNYHEASYQAELAKRDIVILGLYSGWSQGGKTPAQVVSEIKALNPDILLGNYTVVTEVCDSCTSGADKRDKLYNESGPGGAGDWWARDSVGVRTDWATGIWGSHDVNITSFVTPDSNGDRWPQWLAKRDYEQLYQGVDFDIWFFDNNFWRPRSEPDWNGDGSNDSVTDTIVQGWWRAGQREHYDQAAAIAPGLYRIINADNDLSGEVFPENAAPFNQYKDVVHGALLEHVIGMDWSVETWGGWGLMMEWYYEIFDNLLEPKMVLFTVTGDSTDYQLFRYGFASCLLNNGYFQYVSSWVWQSIDPLPWFDEYDLAGTTTTKWLGAPIELPPWTPWLNGVYRRKYENGMAIVNPKGNGRQTVTVESGYRRIAGAQDPLVNNGQSAGSITLDDRDGIILIKSTTGIEQNGGQTPDQFQLFRNYPNPFNPVTTIRYDLPAKTQVEIVIYDILGQQVRSLVNNVQKPGARSITWDGINDAGRTAVTGIYFYRIKTKKFTQTRKMILLK